MSSLYTHLQRNNGFTLNKDLTHVENLGFVVSLKSNTVIVDAELLSQELLNAIVDNLRIRIEENQYIGAWLDVQTLKVHFDINNIFRDLEDAIKSARENDQIAIFNLETQQEIRLISNL